MAIHCLICNDYADINPLQLESANTPESFTSDFALKHVHEDRIECGTLKYKLGVGERGGMINIYTMEARSG